MERCASLPSLFFCWGGGGGGACSRYYLGRLASGPSGDRPHDRSLGGTIPPTDVACGGRGVPGFLTRFLFAGELCTPPLSGQLCWAMVCPLLGLWLLFRARLVRSVMVPRLDCPPILFWGCWRSLFLIVAPPVGFPRFFAFPVRDFFMHHCRGGHSYLWPSLSAFLHDVPGSLPRPEWAMC